MEGIEAHLVDFLVAVLAAVIAVVFLRHRRRAHQAFDADDALDALGALALKQLAWLTAEQYARWQRQVQRLLQQVRFVGCGGLALTDEHRLTIAGMACLLRLQTTAEQEPLFPAVLEVLVYPDAFVTPPMTEAISEDGLELVDDAPDVRIGEQGMGQIVLSWVDVEAALAEGKVQVVIHEFAHALDSENPISEGAPPMADFAEWAAVMSAEFARLQRHRRPPVLDPYGASSPAEFWCVAVEAFFQQPAALAQHHAALFALLARYFELQPRLAPEIAEA